MTEATKLMSKDDATATLMSLKMKMAFRAKKYEEYEKLALDYYKDGSQPSFSSNELNEVAWNFYEQVKDTKSLSKAIQWAEMSVKKDSGYANMDTLAQLYGKIGDKKNAKIWAEKAIQEAEKEGEDAGSTKEFLRKLQ
jgi:TPR repeat protein